MNMYNKFALYYDQSNSRGFYERYASFIKKVIKDESTMEMRLLDLACGTGRLVQLLKSYFAFVEGVDSSVEMLEVAKRKDESIKYYCQDFQGLRIGKKYNVIISTFDSVNYLTNQEELLLAFKNISRHLVEGGIFVFDFNTKDKKLDKEIKKDRVVYRNVINDDFWIANIEMHTEKGIFHERHRERLYSLEEIKFALEEGGLKVRSVYSDIDNMSTDLLGKQRLFVVATK